LAADTPTMQFMFLLGAFAVIAMLMVIGIRQRSIPGTRGHWEPSALDDGNRVPVDDGNRVSIPKRARSHVRSGPWPWSAGVSSSLGYFWDRS
jgi:hypothetical protein